MAGESIVMKLQPDGSITGLRVPDSSALTLEIGGGDDVRLQIDPDTGILRVEQEIDGVWEPASFATGPESLWIGRAVGIAAGGHHILTEDHTGAYHFHTHSDFDGDLSLSDSKTLYAHTFAEGYVAQDDDSNEWIGTSFSWQSTGTIHGLMQKGYWRTGSVAATEPVSIRVWEGTGMGGDLIFDQTYPASTFPASTEVGTHEAGFIELEVDTTYFMVISSTANFSLKTNAAETEPWNAVDLVMVRYDNLLQTADWAETTYDVGQYFIDSRQIYVCNTAGAQTGTFVSNADKWDLMGEQYIEGLFTPGAIPYAGIDGRLTEAPTDLLYDDMGYLHTPALAIFNEDPILKRGDGISLIKQEETEFSIVHLNTLTKSAFFKYYPVADEFYMDKDLRLDAGLKVVGPLTVNTTEVVGTDGYVNKAAIEDSENWDDAYGWGDHSIVGYLTSETDPVFIAWDKSTGIEITESQITDLDHFTTNDETDPVFFAWDKSTGIEIVEAQISDLAHFSRYVSDLYGMIEDYVPFGNVTGGLTQSADLTFDGSVLKVNGSSVLTSESDPIFSAWDKSSGISIVESQISDLAHFSRFVSDLYGMIEDCVPFGTASGGLTQSANLTFDGSALKVNSVSVLTSESDPVFTAWDKSTGISITESQISDLSHFVTGDETDPIFSAWDKSTGISITTSQVSDHSYYGADLLGFTAGRVAFGSDLGSGLDDSADLTYSSGTLSLGDGGIFIGRSGNDPYLRFLADGSGQIRADSTSIKITNDSGSVDRFKVGTATGAAWIQTSLDVPEISNTLGDLLIQPDVQGDVYLFSGTNVGNDENGKYLYIYRKAAEGNEYMRFYISSNQSALIHSSCPMTLQGQTNFTINSVTSNVIFKVGDNAGVNKFFFRDSDANNVMTLDSNGLLGLGKTAETHQLEILSTAPTVFLENSRSIMGMGYYVGGLIFSAGEPMHQEVAEIRVNAAEDWTSISSPTEIKFYTTPVGSLTREVAMVLGEDKSLTIEGDLVVLGSYPGGSDKEYASFYLGANGVSGVADTAVTLVLNQESANSDGAIFILTDSEVTVNQTGDFKITGDCYFNNSSNNRTEYTFWLEQDSVEVDGTRVGIYARGYDSGSTGSFSIVIPVTSGDMFRLRIVRTDGGGTAGYQDSQGTRLTFLEV